MAIERLTKAQAIAHWSELTPRQDPLAPMKPIPNKTTGSRYGECGVRIDGTRAFIDAVLSNLQNLLAGEDSDNRLELNYTEVAARGPDKKPLAGVGTGNWCCYIRLHERGIEARMVNGFVDAMCKR